MNVPPLPFETQPVPRVHRPRPEALLARALDAPVVVEGCLEDWPLLRELRAAATPEAKVAALGARRSLLSLNLHMPKDYAARVRLESALVRGEGDAASAARARGVTHLVATPALLTAYPEISLLQLRARRDLREVFFTGDPADDYVALFEIGTP